MKILLNAFILSMTIAGVAEAQVINETHLRCDLTSKLTVLKGDKVIRKTSYDHLGATFELSPYQSSSQTRVSGVNEKELWKKVSIQGTKEEIVVEFDATYRNGSRKTVEINAREIVSLKNGSFTLELGGTIPEPNATYGKQTGLLSDFVLRCKEI